MAVPSADLEPVRHGSDRRAADMRSLRERLRSARRAPAPPRRAAEVFTAGDRLLIANSTPELAGTPGDCVARNVGPTVLRCDGRH